MNGQGIGREKVSTTFHGRDLFAPAAARLVAGTPPQRLGRPTTEFVDLDLGASRKNGAAVVGDVIYVDTFGNLITTIPSSTLAPDGRAVQVMIGRKRSAATLERTYGDAAPGRVVVVPGSDGLLEVAVREGNAAEHFAASQGTSVRIEALARKQR
jgi:S-adenosylmethionine hydrolase